MSGTTIIREARRYTLHVSDTGAGARRRITIPAGTEDEQDAAAWASAREYAEEWAQDGYTATESTIYATVSYWWEDMVSGDHTTSDAETITVTIEPEEPECEDGQDHCWRSPYEIVGGLRENPGVLGHGGGVIITEVCSRCGCARVTDTWAQNSETGEQGLTSVTYDPGYMADRHQEDGD